MAEYQMPLLREVESRLKAKCDKLANAFIDDIGEYQYWLSPCTQALSTYMHLLHLLNGDVCLCNKPLNHAPLVNQPNV